MGERERMEERLRAYIYPNVASSKAQIEAFDEAVDAQLTYESEQGGGEIPGNARSYSIGNYSVTLAEAALGADTRATVCPAAWAILFNAGLLRRTLPVAKRL